MKKLYRIIFICFLIFSFPLVSLAHWMPISESFVGGVGPGCTLGYVKSVYGEPVDKKWFNTDGVRGVGYIYSENFRITGRTWYKDTRPEDDLIVVGYTLTNNSLSTESGLTVGIPYSTVAGMYGYGQKFVNKEGRVSYIYAFPNSATSMSFRINSDDIVDEIYVGTEF